MSFYQYGLTLIPAKISYYIHWKVWDEITYPFLNFNSCTVDVIPFLTGYVITYPYWD